MRTGALRNPPPMALGGSASDAGSGGFRRLFPGRPQRRPPPPPRPPRPPPTAAAAAGEEGGVEVELEEAGGGYSHLGSGSE